MNTILQSIVPAQTLGIQMKDWTDGRVELMAPLAPNRNDKGTAFAGSIVSMLSLAGWAAITLALREAGGGGGEHAEIVDEHAFRPAREVGGML